VVVATGATPGPELLPTGRAVYVPTPPDAAERRKLGKAVPDARALPVRVAVGPWVQSPPPVSWNTGPLSDDVAVVADEAVLDAFEIDDHARDVLAEHGVVVLHERAQDVTVTLPDGRSWETRSVPSRHTPSGLSAVLVAPLTARDAGVRVRAGATAFRNPDPLDDLERGALTDLLYDSSLRAATIEWWSPPTGPSPFVLQLLLSGAALLFSVLVVGSSLALAAAESREERDALTLAGAPPRVLARTAGAKAGLLSGLGGLLALPIGFLPVVVFVAVERDGFPLRVPWPTVGALVVFVPLAAAVVAWSISGAAQRLRPVRVSTVAWD
jgi:hypothetical protein